MNIAHQIFNIRKEEKLTQEEFGKLFRIGKKEKIIPIYKHS